MATEQLRKDHSEQLSRINEQNKLVRELEKQKQSIEFSRYKQDCRKRALELAIDKWIGVFDADKNNTKDEVFSKADEYYNWLVSIPEK